MNILLLGGTGAIGTHLSSSLSHYGHRVYITSRKPHENAHNIQYLCGNAKEIDFLTDVTQLLVWDSIVDFMCYSTKEFKERIDILLRHTKQYVYLSSARVYSDSTERITEKSPRLLDVSSDNDYLKTDEYALYKAREEDILLSYQYKNYTILRPYITYGEYRLPLGVWEKETWLKRALSGKSIAMPRTFLHQDTSLAYGRDASSLISRLIGNPESIGQIYNIVSGHSETWESVARIYIEEVNKIKHSNIELIEFGQCCYTIKQVIKCFLHKLTIRANKYGPYSWGNYQLIYDREFSRSFDDTKTRQLLPDFKFGSNDISLRRCINHFSCSPRYDYINYNWEMVQDRITGEKTPLSYFPKISLKIKYIAIRYIIPSYLIYSK